MHHTITTREEWTKARKTLLAKEKEYTHLRDRLAEERRALPWVKVEKNYVFDTAEGKKTLSDLFGGNSQLIVYHFMWSFDLDMGCDGCSFYSDHIDGAYQHIKHHDVSFVAISRGPIEKLEAYKKRMDWKFPFASSAGSDFNFDFHVSFTQEQLAKGEVYYNYEMTKDGFGELPGTSVFYKSEKGEIFHTYSSYARGGEELIGAYMLLDLTPKGRNESEIMDWMRRHDEYEKADGASCCAA